MATSKALESTPAGRTGSPPERSRSGALSAPASELCHQAVRRGRSARLHLLRLGSRGLRDSRVAAKAPPRRVGAGRLEPGQRRLDQSITSPIRPSIPLSRKFYRIPPEYNGFGRDVTVSIRTQS